VERARLVSSVPLFAGFGISTPGHAAEAAAIADGIVVGSRAIQTAEESGPSGLKAYCRTLRDALDGV
jgi:tryptophan synthase alpha chain